MSHLLAGVLGAAVGDALGVPWERRKRDTFLAEDMLVFGGQPLPVGTWSDDTSMTLAEVASLGERGCYDEEDIMRRFCDWLYRGEYTPHGKTFGIGRTTSLAISRFRDGTCTDLCGGCELLDNGNGALMRMLPFALLNDPNRDAIADRAGCLTHSHAISRNCCRLYVRIVDGLLDGRTPEESVARALTPLPDGIADCIAGRLLSLGVTERADIKSSGYVLDTLTASLWCLIHTDSYADAVLAAVNLGGDTDTTGSVTGGLAGIYYGLNGETGIPAAWSHALVRYDWIESLCAKADALMR
ncbi:MAG: ADP-ribosylglycohydrolase family protein [Sutterella sp.]|nr:ADP-ribosylglycohydrolase family protein [Sutterella sp.]